MGEHKKPYPQLAPTAIASYNYTDVEDNTGVVIYYPFKGSDASAQINMMSAQADYTEEKGQGGDRDGAVAEVMDIKFESGAFNVTRNVRGTALFRLPWGYTPKNSDEDLAGSWVITVYKYDGSTETSIATVTSRTYTTATGVQIPYNSVSMIELVLPKTNIAVGDVLRVRLQLSVGRTVGTAGASAWAVGYDPKDTSFAFVGASKTMTLNDPQMAFFIPFDLDL